MVRSNLKQVRITLVAVNKNIKQLPISAFRKIFRGAKHTGAAGAAAPPIILNSLYENGFCTTNNQRESAFYSNIS